MGKTKQTANLVSNGFFTPDSDGIGIGTTNPINAALQVEGRNFAFGGPGNNESGAGNLYIGNYNNPLLDSYERNIRIGSTNEIQIELYTDWDGTQYGDSIIYSSPQGMGWQFSGSKGGVSRSLYPINYSAGNALTDDRLFFQAGNKYLWFDGDTGRLGINRSSESGWSDTLDVNGTARVTGVAKFDSNVGIGTQSPGSLVHALGSYGTIRIENSNTAQYAGAGLELKGPAGDERSTKLVHGNSDAGGTETYFQIEQLNSSGSYVKTLSTYSYQYDYWAFNTGGSEKLRITSAGNVGIATVTPERLLDVGHSVYDGTPLRLRCKAESYALSSSARQQYTTAGTIVEVVGTTPTSGHAGTLFDIQAYAPSPGGAQNIFLGAVATGTRVNGAAEFVLGRRTATTSWAESLRVDNQGFLLVNHNASLRTGTPLQVSGNDDGIGVFRFNGGASAEANITLYRSRSGIIGNNTALQNGDSVGTVFFAGASGSTYERAAGIGAVVDGESVTAGDTSDMPGKLVFLTTPDGSGTPTEKMSIDKNGLTTILGDLRIGNRDGYNSIAFRGTTGDGVPPQTPYTLSWIGERIYGGTEQAELLIVKGNDAAASSGPDRVRIFAAETKIDTYTTWGDYDTDFDDVGAKSSINIAHFKKGEVVYGDTGQSEDTVLHITANSSYSSTVRFGDQNDSNVGEIQYNHNTETMNFRVQDDTKFRINGAKCKLEAPGGINFAQPSWVGSTQPYSNHSDYGFSGGAATDGVLYRGVGQAYLAVDDIFRIRDNINNSENKRFEFNTNDGNAGADASWNSNNFDFAEMFEWSDGNPEAEDRIGYSVCVDTLTGKIRKAEEGDTPFGVVSGTASFVANAGEHKWTGYWKRDEWGRTIQEPAYNGEGEPLLDDEGNHRYKTAVNPDWDESLVHTYIPRSKRPEWSAIGVMGQVYMRKGCPVDSRWVKLKEIDSVKDLWLIR